jgi:hypothetical protein
MEHAITEKPIKESHPSSPQSLLTCVCGWTTVSDNKFIQALKLRHTQKF